LWDIEQRRLIRTVPTRIERSFDTGQFGEVLFDNTGNRFVYMGVNSTIEVWNAEAAKAARAPIAAPGVRRLLGFDSANHLVAVDESNGYNSIKFWDLEARRESGFLRLASLLDFKSTVEDGQRISVGGTFEMPYELPITAEQWFAHLCRTLNRGFTESERVLLPPGTDLNPPCSMNR